MQFLKTYAPSQKGEGCTSTMPVKGGGGKKQKPTRLPLEESADGLLELYVYCKVHQQFSKCMPV